MEVVPIVFRRPSPSRWLLHRSPAFVSPPRSPVQGHLRTTRHVVERQIETRDVKRADVNSRSKAQLVWCTHVRL